MDFADALSWLVGLTAAVGLVTSVRQLGAAARGWVIVQAVILAAAVAAGMLKRPEFAYAAAAGWLLFVHGPRFAQRRANEHFAAFSFDPAARWARVAAWLHPFGDARSQATLVEAQGEMIRGRYERARALLAEAERSPGLRDLVRIERLRLDRDWRAIVEELATKPRATSNPMLLMPYLRALGETGDPSRLLATYARLPAVFRRVAPVRLVVAAFAGRPELVTALFEGPLAGDPAPSRAYWLAVAQQARGDGAAAARLLGTLISGDVLLEQAKHRLLTPAPRVDTALLSPEAQRTLGVLARDIREARALPGAATKPRRPVATLALMGVLALVFVAGLLQDGTRDETLIRFGALLVPPEPEGGAWWRVAAAGFLNVNATHLAMNLLGLWVLGRAVERGFGSLPMLGAFLGSSIGAYVLGLFFMPVPADGRALALGSSAGVLGLVGALAGHAAVGFVLKKNRMLGRQLAGMGFVVAIQLVFDAYHPNVSSFLHLAGAGSGAVIALPYAVRRFRRD
jgi:membrane associated rhomboid family serine protease